MPGMFTTGFKEAGVDIGSFLVEKAYLIDVYPQLTGNLVLPSLWSWGHNNYGQLGDNTIVLKSSPAQTVAGGTNWKQVSNGNGHTAAIKTDGTLWVWGQNQYGGLGDNTIVLKSSPIQTVAGGTNWKQIACGSGHTAAIKTDGTLWNWGFNLYGQLGVNYGTDVSSPVQTIAGGTNWKQVSGGLGQTAAIKTDGTLWLWGYNTSGQLGDTTTNDRWSPVQTVAGGTNWKQVACGQYHTAAVKTDGTLWSWGYNGRGQLGDNTIVSKSSPIQTVAGGTNWKQVACGQYHTAVVKTDGTLWAWGDRTYGQLGNNLGGAGAHTSSPIQTVAGGTNWKLVTCGFNHTAAIKTDGTLWLWGINTYGHLGDNTIVSKSSPVQTVAGGTNWKQIACGLYHTVALTDSDY